MNAGEKTIEWFYRENLRVDEQWSVKLPKPCTWRPDQNAPRIKIIGAELSSNLERSIASERLRAIIRRSDNEKSL